MEGAQLAKSPQVDEKDKKAEDNDLIALTIPSIPLQPGTSGQLLAPSAQCKTIPNQSSDRLLYEKNLLQNIERFIIRIRMVA